MFRITITTILFACVVVLSPLGLIQLDTRTRKHSGNEKLGPVVPLLLGSEHSQVHVVPKTMEDATKWIHEEHSNSRTVTHEADNPASVKYHEPENDGHEAVVYLTYTTIHYVEAPETLIIEYTKRKAWNDEKLLDTDNARGLCMDGSRIGRKADTTFTFSLRIGE